MKQAALALSTLVVAASPLWRARFATAETTTAVAGTDSVSVSGSKPTSVSQEKNGSKPENSHVSKEEGKTPAGVSIQESNQDLLDTGTIQRAAPASIPHWQRGAFFETDFVPVAKSLHKVHAKKKSRRNRRQRTRKLSKGAAKKSAKSTKGKNRILDNGCIQGTSSFVTENCKDADPPCCQDLDACQWPEDDIATVCPGSCLGNRSCYYVSADAYIGFGSCHEPYSCYAIAFKSTKAATVGSNSCVGRYSCDFACERSMDCKVDIDRNACQGYAACFGLARFREDTKKVSIGPGACVGRESCLSISQGEKIEIAKGSCTDFRSCFQVGYWNENATKIKIDEYSCTAEGSCYLLGNYASKIDIGHASCTGPGACGLVGALAPGSVKVGDGSCLADSSCLSLGSNATKVTVGDDACLDYLACFQFGDLVMNDKVTIKDDQCSDAAEECTGGACRTSSKVVYGVCHMNP